MARKPSAKMEGEQLHRQMATTPLRAQHEAAGAVLETYFGCILPDRFTDFASEYRLARDAVAVLDTNYHAIATLEGPDRVRYLNAVLTNNIQGLASGQGCISLLLNPQGHILAEIECYALYDRLIAISHEIVRERTLSTLDRFIIMDDVTLADITADTGTIAIEGPKARYAIQQLCGVSLEDMPDFGVTDCEVATAARTIPCRMIRRSHFGAIGAEFLISLNSIAEVWETAVEASRALGGGPIGYAALNALRLQAGIAWFSHDFDDSVIPHEAALEGTHISYSKGCYTGQEIVERVRSRGHVNRRRVGLEFSSRTAPAHGAILTAEGKEVGWVTSAAYSPALARVIGMGYLRREHNSPGSAVDCLGAAATVVSMPFEAQRVPTVSGGS